MKHIYSCLIFVLFSFTSIIAQPILNQNNFTFNFPDSTIYFIADSNSVLDNSIGANVVFNYDSLKGYGMLQKAFYIDPTTTALTSSFSTASLAEKSDASTQNFIYSLSSADSVTNLGFVANVVGFGLTTAKYNLDPEAIIRFPFTFGNSYSDNYAGSFSVNHAIAGLVTTNASGTVNISADAWGKLDLPHALSFDSVIRVTRVENSITDPINVGVIIPAISVNATITNYYKPSISKAPLLSFVDGSYTQNGSIIQSSKTVVSQYPIGIVSVNEINILNSIELYPNPSENNHTTLTLTIENPTKIKVAVLNALGQEICKIAGTQLIFGNNKFQINTSKFLPGIYFVSIEIDGKVKGARKLIVD